jgi:phage shock protein A
LEELVREKVKTYLTSQRDTLVAKLSQKVKDLQQNNDLWKRQVKDLQVKVNDVTVLQQKLEKRKAATAALRVIVSILSYVDIKCNVLLNVFDFR